MYSSNLSKYVTKGYGVAPDKKRYRKRVVGPILLFVLGGIVPGIILRSYWLQMTFSLLVIATISTLTVFVVSSKSLTLKRCLIIDSIIYSAWVSEISILELMYFSMWQGVQGTILLLYLPTLVLPVLMGLKTHRVLMKDTEYDPENEVQSKIKLSGFFAGILGMNFAARFRHVEQGVAIIIVLICFAVLNCFMSLGLLSIQKLYYLRKYNISEPIN